MPTVAFTFFNSFLEKESEKVFNLETDTIKIMLSNTAPNAATNTVKADITEISAGNGYSAGGTAIANNATNLSGTDLVFTGDDVVFTASGGSIGPLRYPVIYSDTATNDELIGYLDYGSAITITDGNTLTIGPSVALDGFFKKSIV
jgi:hypothetical protein